MQVFISWSGTVSRVVAHELSRYLKHILRNIDTFVSTQDVDAGDRWEARISEELETANHAVLCVTKDNQTAPWLLYEAGALGKLVGRSKVIPYTIGFSPQELAVGPLSRFQGIQNDEAGSWELIRSLNRSLPIPEDEGFAHEAFNKWWPDWEKSMREALTSHSPEPDRIIPSDRELLLELRKDMNHVLQYIRRSELDNLRKQQGHFIELSARDDLTELANRRYLETRLAELNNWGVPRTFAMLDLDNFKFLNDTYGHSVGDRVLTVVASKLSEAMKSGDLVARYGGEEFGLVFVNMSAEAAAQMLREFIAGLPEDLQELGFSPVTASVGVSASHLGAPEVQLREADSALYEAKRQGKNRVVIYSKPDDASSLTVNA